MAGKKEFSCRRQMNKAALVMARLHFTAFVLSKNIDENKMPKFTLLFNYFAGLDFFPHLGFLTPKETRLDYQPLFGKEPAFLPRTHGWTRGP